MGFVAKAVKGVVKAVVGVVKGVVKAVTKVLGGVLGMVRPKGNKSNAATDGRLSKRLDPEDFRKIIFGKTAFGCDLRFWEVFNSPTEDDWDDYAEVIAAATHQVNSYGSFYAENELIGFDGSGLSTHSKFDGLKRTTHLGGSAAALSAGSGSYWTSTSKFTGCAHYVLRWKVTDKRLPGGVPGRITQEGEGALVYDPRKDSTRGGTGTHRADDQTTWQYSPLDSNGKPIGRNNALQMLWYLIGWRINGKLVAGRGIDLEDINWPEWIAAANDAESRQYYTDMILSTGDDHETNEGIISADGLLGELLDPGGLWTYKVTKDDTADIAVSLSEDHVIDAGPVEWVPTPPMSEQFNEVAGTYIDPSATSLYQAKAYPVVTDASYVTADGFRKRDSHNFQCVQDVALAQKLARIKLNRARFGGVFKATFNFTALKAQVYSNVQLTLERYGFVNKLFKVYSQTVTEQGIEMVLREEHASVYAAGSVTVPPAPSSIPRPDPTQTFLVTGLSAAAIATTAGSGTTNHVGVRLTWDLTTGRVRRLEAEYKKSTDTTWTPLGFIGADKTSTDVLGLLGVTAYDFRVRTWSDFEQPSAWVTASATTTPWLIDWTILDGTIPATVENQQVLDRIANDEVLSVPEKYDLMKVVGDMEARYLDLYNRATALGISTTALTGARGAWQNLLSSYSPAYNNLLADTDIYAHFFADRDFTAGWTNSGLVLTAGSPYTTLEDNSAAATESITRSKAQTGANEYTAAIVVKKDAVGRATRFPTLRLSGIGGTAKTGDVSFDTATGESSASADVEDHAVIDMGTDWLVYATMTLNADNTSAGMTILPAHGASATWVTGVAAVGSIDVFGYPLIAAGDWTKLGRWMITARLAAYSAEITKMVNLLTAADFTVIVQPSTTIMADSAGVPKTDEVPKAIGLQLLQSGAAVTSGVTWSATRLSGNATFSTAGSGSGTLTITGPTDATLAVENEFEVTATFAGQAHKATCKVIRQDDPPTSGGGGGGGGAGSTASTTTLGATTNTTYGLTTDVSATLTVKAGAAGQVALAAPLGFKRSPVSPTAGPEGANGAAGKWQWRAVGGSWADVGSEVLSASPSETIDMGGGEDPWFKTDAGSLSVSQTKTGLTNGTDYEFRFVWRRTNVSGTARNVIRSSGTLTATAS